jgi:hypothetical protein
VQLLGALFDLPLQVGMGLLQAAGHVVELVGKRLDLVAGLDGDALAEVAAAEARGAGTQRRNFIARWLMRKKSQACTSCLMLSKKL